MIRCCCLAFLYVLFLPKYIMVSKRLGIGTGIVRHWRTCWDHRKNSITKSLRNFEMQLPQTDHSHLHVQSPRGWVCRGLRWWCNTVTWKKCDKHHTGQMQKANELLFSGNLQYSLIENWSAIDKTECKI